MKKILALSILGSFYIYRCCSVCYCQNYIDMQGSLPYPAVKYEDFNDIIIDNLDNYEVLCGLAGYLYQSETTNANNISIKSLKCLEKASSIDSANPYPLIKYAFNIIQAIDNNWNQQTIMKWQDIAYIKLKEALELENDNLLIDGLIGYLYYKAGMEEKALRTLCNSSSKGFEGFLEDEVLYRKAAFKEVKNKNRQNDVVLNDMETVKNNYVRFIWLTIIGLLEEGKMPKSYVELECYIKLSDIIINNSKLLFNYYQGLVMKNALLVSLEETSEENNEDIFKINEELTDIAQKFAEVDYVYSLRKKIKEKYNHIYVTNEDIENYYLNGIQNGQLKAEKTFWEKFFDKDKIKVINKSIYLIPKENPKVTL